MNSFKLLASVSAAAFVLLLILRRPLGNLWSFTSLAVLAVFALACWRFLKPLPALARQRVRRQPARSPRGRCAAGRNDCSH